MGLGKRIRELRIKNNMTQQNLADKLFVTPQAISRWEKGIVEPSISTILKLSVIFNVSITELVNYDKKE